MKTGIGVFFAAVFALGASWCGLVLAPTLQLGGAKLTTALGSGDTYPIQRTGDATLGLQIYRANGCAACHTEQVRQDGVACEVSLTGLGKNQPDDFKKFVASLQALPEWQEHAKEIAMAFGSWDGTLPKVVIGWTDKETADKMNDLLKAAGCKSETRIYAFGPDIARGWGLRHSVAADFLYDNPVQLGSLRAGPDLSNIGVRMPDANIQLQHLYAPKAIAKNSTMPAFRYLFETRKIGDAPLADAVTLPKEFAPAAGYEVVPKPEARELVAYLLSLRANVPLYEAPFTPAAAKP
jgi:cbb3-type cytochrome oxidase cytochrome c subunit